MSLDHLVADALDHPEQYYVYIGNRYYVQRNYEQALQAYTTALGYDPESADAYFGVAQCKWKLRDTSGGMVAIQKTLSFWLTSLEH